MVGVSSTFLNEMHMNCFTNIIGITDTTDPCFDDIFSDDARKSDSGKYMDQIEEFPSLDVFKNVASSERKTLEGLLTKSRENGIQYFQEEVYRQLGIRYQSKSVSYIGNVGQDQYTGIVNIAFPLGGCVLDMQGYKGAVVKVTAITPYFNFDGILAITVYRCINNGIRYINLEQIAQFNVNTSIASPAQQTIAPLSLETTDETGTRYSYLFMYSTNQGLPRNNAASCGCGGKETVMHQYFYPYGIVGVDSDNLLLSNRYDKVNGLVMQVEARCTGGDFMCENYYSDQYVREAMVWAILRKSVANAIVAMLNSDLINRYTMAKREQMGYVVNILNSKFKSGVSWIAENMDLSNNDCFICNPGGNDGSFSTTVGGIYM